MVKCQRRSRSRTWGHFRLVHSGGPRCFHRELSYNTNGYYKALSQVPPFDPDDISDQCNHYRVSQTETVPRTINIKCLQACGVYCQVPSCLKTSQWSWAHNVHAAPAIWEAAVDGLAKNMVLMSYFFSTIAFFGWNSFCRWKSKTMM